MSGIYLAFTHKELEEKRQDLFNTLQKAGQQVFPHNTTYNEEFFHYVSEEISKSNAFVLLLGLNHDEFVTPTGMSLSEYQLSLAMKRNESDPNYKVFIWFPFSLTEVTNEQQHDFISNIRNNIRSGVYFSNSVSPIQLVDDLRTSIKVESKEEFDINPTDVFLVYNQLDDLEAGDIVDMLSDIVPVEKLNIIQDSDLEYSELCAQQISKSKLAVVYFKESADWALPFTQQIWKKIGGASSHTPILLIGDEDPETNVNKKFKAPKVVSLIVAGELIPLEIKVQYDKVVEGVI
jgi:hypothetical protein